MSLLSPKTAHFVHYRDTERGTVPSYLLNFLKWIISLVSTQCWRTLSTINAPALEICVSISPIAQFSLKFFVILKDSQPNVFEQTQ